MSRKKTAKRPATRKTPAQPAMNVSKMEKDFQEAPAKLAASINKEITSHTQKQTKSKSALNKLAKQIKASEKRVKAAGKLKTAAGKKQLTAAKKLHADMMKSEIAHTKEIKEAGIAIVELQAKAKKMAALVKHMNQFEKDWAKQEKEAAAKANQKAKEKLKAKKAAKAAAKAAAKKQKAQPAADQMNHTSADESMFEETMETADTTETL